MAKTKIKLRTDQAAIVFNADGSYELFLHAQPEEAEATPANMAATFAAFALESTPMEVMKAIIQGVAESESVAAHDDWDDADIVQEVAPWPTSPDWEEADVVDVDFGDGDAY